MNKKKLYKKVVAYIKETYKNKLVAILLISVSYLSALEGDGTAFAFVTLIFGLPLLLAKENHC